MRDGEIEKKRANIGFLGKGFKFDAEEENKIKEFRKELSKDYGFTVDEKEDEPENPADAQAQKDQKEKVEMLNLLRMLDRDENAKKLALEAGNKASREAL